jgi:hypothetical protein
MVSRSNYSKMWDIALGSLGTMTTAAFISLFGLLYNTISFLGILAGTVVIIHIGRLFKNLSLN